MWTDPTFPRAPRVRANPERAWSLLPAPFTLWRAHSQPFTDSFLPSLFSYLLLNLCCLRMHHIKTLHIKLIQPDAHAWMHLYTHMYVTHIEKENDCKDNDVLIFANSSDCPDVYHSLGFPCFLIYFCSNFGFKSRALCMGGKCSTMEPDT